MNRVSNPIATVARVPRVLDDAVHRTRRPWTALLSLTLAAAVTTTSTASGPDVRTLRLPDGGYQPQLAVGQDGTAHVVFLKGDSSHADAFYARVDKTGRSWSKPLRVNSQPGSAIGAGTIRGAHIALGRNDRVHVAWMGSDEAEPKAVETQIPMLYSRLNESGTAFEPQRNLIRRKAGLDGGGAIAADAGGNVYVFWHAPDGDTHDEASRRVWVARSTDDGKTFAPENAAFEKPTGACACCGMRAFADRGGSVLVLYRTAADGKNRDMYLLQSTNAGSSFDGAKVDGWQSSMCVMSTASFAAGSAGALAAWETKGQVFFGAISKDGPVVPARLAAPSTKTKPKRKHPVTATSADGRVILAWNDGSNWRKGGKVAWQVFDAAGQPVPESSGKAKGLPAWGLAAVCANADGSFTVIY